MTEETSTPLPPARKNKWAGRRWLDIAVALLALVISIVSIFVAQKSNQSMERVMRAGAWPFVQIGSGNTSDEGVREISFDVANVGTGAAQVYTFEMEVDGAPLPAGGHLLTRLLQACCEEEFTAAAELAGGESAAIGPELSSPVAERFLAPNSSIYALRWQWSEQNAELWAALDRARQSGRIVSTVCYCSVFDDCWIAHTNTFPPEEINYCPDSSRAQSR